MDRFKFRVWDCISKKYQDDYFMGQNGLLYAQFSECVSVVDHTPLTIEQCTGLKDKNGKLIYEGDIVKVIRQKNRDTDDYVENIAYLEYWNNSRGFTFSIVGKCLELFNQKIIDSFQWYGGIKYIEIIGNIHENPELLES